MTSPPNDWSASWDARYASAVEPGRRSVARCRGTGLMFHSVLDGRLAIRPGTVESILLADTELQREVLERWGVVPDEITTEADVILGFAASLSSGRAMQRMIRSERVFQWVLETFGYDELALGGTSANMALAVAELGVPRVLLYANPLTKPLADAFPGDTTITTVGPDGAIGTPREVAVGDEVFAIHWIFEYRAGDTLTIGPHTLTAERANRFIPSWNPANNQLALSDAFVRQFRQLAPDFSHVFVSGFHILSDRYPDGTTAFDCIEPVARELDELRAAAPQLRIHAELASIGGEVVRKGVLEDVLPRVDSLGLNEAELITWLGDIGRSDLAAMIDESNAPAAVLEGLAEFANATGVPRVHLHNLGYYLVLARDDAGAPESICQGLLTGATAAAVRAMTGRPARGDELVPRDDVPLHEPARAAMEDIRRAVGADGDFLTSGIGRHGDRHIVMIPTRVVANPVRTVGLGDTISSASWLAEG